MKEEGPHTLLCVTSANSLRKNADYLASPFSLEILTHLALNPGMSTLCPHSTWPCCTWFSEYTCQNLVGRKVMTNLDSILQSRDISLPTKVRLVEAMVFPVVMYRCESWTTKKAEHQRIDAFELCCWRRPLDCKEIQLVNSKGN